MNKDNTGSQGFGDFEDPGYEVQEEFLVIEEDQDDPRPLRLPRSRSSSAPGKTPLISTRSGASTSQQGKRTHRLRRRQRIWPWMLAGAAGGIVLLVLAAAIIVFVALRSIPATPNPSHGAPGSSNPTNFTQPPSVQTLSLTNISQMTVDVPVGDVTIKVDSHFTAPQVTSVKKVHAGSQDEANKAFKGIAVPLQTVGTVVMIKATLPDTNNERVDLGITLPPGVISTASGSFTLNVSAPFGNVETDGLSGVLTIRANLGDITVHHATLADCSHIETSQGNIIFDGSLDTTTVTDVSCHPSTPSQPIYSIVGEAKHKTLTITLSLLASTNIILDASTNEGTITSDFPKVSNGSQSYYGPLLADPALTPTAVLRLDMSLGDIHLHKG